VPLQDFGNPESDVTRLCVYDQTGPDTYALALRASPSVPGGGVWKGTSSRWTFRSSSGAPDGVTRVVLKAGSQPGRTKVRVVAKKNPTFPTSLPLHVQPRVVAQYKSSHGTCWGAAFSAPSANGTGLFRAKSD